MEPGTSRDVSRDLSRERSPNDLSDRLFVLETRLAERISSNEKKARNPPMEAHSRPASRRSILPSRRGNSDSDSDSVSDSLPDLEPDEPITEVKEIFKMKKENEKTDTNSVIESSRKSPTRINDRKRQRKCSKQHHLNRLENTIVISSGSESDDRVWSSMRKPTKCVKPSVHCDIVDDVGSTKIRHFSDVLCISSSSDDDLKEPLMKRSRVKSPILDGEKRHVIFISSDSESDNRQSCGSPRVKRPVLSNADKSKSNPIPTAIVKPIVRVAKPTVCVAKVEESCNVSQVPCSPKTVSKIEPISKSVGGEVGSEVKVKVETSLKPQTIVNYVPDEKLIEVSGANDSELPDIPEARAPDVTYSDCLRIVPSHGSCSIIKRSVRPQTQRVYFTHNQCESIESCLEEKEEKYLLHAIWCLEYCLVEREMMPEFAGIMVQDLLLTARSPELIFNVHGCLLRALSRYPPAEKIGFDGDFFVTILSKCMGEESLGFSLVLDYLVCAFQAEFLNRKLMDSSDVRRCLVQKQFGLNGNSHHSLRHVIKHLHIMTSLMKTTENQHYSSARKIFHQISRILEMVVLSCRKHSETVQRVVDYLVNFTKDQCEEIKNIVFADISSPLLKLRFLEVYQNWNCIEDVISSVKEDPSMKTLSRVCMYLETQVVIAKGDLTVSLSQRLLNSRSTDNQQETPHILTQLSYSKRNLEKIIKCTTKAAEYKSKLVPFLMRLEILMESVFE